MEEDLHQQELDESNDEDREFDGIHVCGYFVKWELVQAAAHRHSICFRERK